VKHGSDVLQLAVIEDCRTLKAYRKGRVSSSLYGTFRGIRLPHGYFVTPWELSPRNDLKEDMDFMASYIGELCTLSSPDLKKRKKKEIEPMGASAPSLRLYL